MHLFWHQFSYFIQSFLGWFLLGLPAFAYHVFPSSCPSVSHEYIFSWHICIWMSKMHICFLFVFLPYWELLFLAISPGTWSNSKYRWSLTYNCLTYDFLTSQWCKNNMHSAEIVLQIWNSIFSQDSDTCFNTLPWCWAMTAGHSFQSATLSQG